MEAVPCIDLSVVIVNWNVRELLRDCLDSLYRQTRGLTFEVIVVDNASSDGSAEMLAREYPSVQLIANRANIGFGKANNLALTRARGEFVGLLNPDTILTNDAFGTMVAKLRQDSSIGIVGPQLLSADGTVQRVCARRFIAFSFLIGSLFANSLRARGEDLGESEYQISHQVECISGACMVIRREALAQGRIFDPQFHIYGEDVDLCAEVARGGWAVYYLSDARVMHLGGQSAKQSSIVVQQATEASYLLTRKRYGRVAGYVYRFACLVAATGKFAVAWGAQLRPRRRDAASWRARQSAYAQMMTFALRGHRG